MEGIICRGRLVKVELPDSPDGFANASVESRKFSGEPKWTRLGYPTTQQGTSAPTRVAEQVAAIPVESVVECQVEPKVSKSGMLWYRLIAIEVVEPADQSTNGSGRKARAGAAA